MDDGFVAGAILSGLVVGILMFVLMGTDMDDFFECPHCGKASLYTEFRKLDDAVYYRAVAEGDTEPFNQQQTKR